MFFRFLALFVVIAVVSAFQSSTVRKISPSLKMADMVGSSVEVKFVIPFTSTKDGEAYDPFDMLNLHSVAPSVFPHPKWLRESELKHSRAAMLASVGAFSGQWGLAIPGYTPNADPVTNLNLYALEWPGGLAQIILAIGIIEGNFFPGEMWFGKGEREAGDFGYDPIGYFKNKTPAQKDTLRLQELKNGRLAMLALAAYTSEHWIPGSVPFLPGTF